MMVFFLLYLLAGCALSLLLLYLISLRKVYSVKGKHVLITGGSSGIGKALAAEALKRGASSVTIVARNEEKLEQAKTELLQLVSDRLAQKVNIVSVDVSSLSEVKESLTEAVKKGGHVDVLVNCAGITHTDTLVDTPSEKFQELLRVNVLGSVFPTQALLPAMMERREGRIVFVSSQAGQLGLHGYTGYSATKYGLRGLAEVLQMEVKSHNIGVSISFPPDTNTPQLRAELEQRDGIQKELASFGTVFEADVIARDIWTGVERGRFLIHHGLDGFMLATITAGMSPVHSLWEATTQVLLSGVFRIVSLFYLAMFYKVVDKGIKAKNKNK